MARPSSRLLYSFVVCLFFVVPLFATRVKDGGSSGNGQNPSGNVPLCPDSKATPFFAQLDGTQKPPDGCIGEDDNNQPNPPSPYPNRVVVLSGSGFTVTVTPSLWQNAGFNKKTILQVTFSGQTVMTLQSLVIGSQLNNPAYVVCDSFNTTGIPVCTNIPFLLDPTNSFPSALEPAGIALADTTTTR